ncbi:DUF6020 family protein [Vagococcus fluvialis]|uniref:DUF6020 family protein n=1 Tax=Vagococcus fluvialis TaxID=2738 RepID=UPI0037D193EE
MKNFILAFMMTIGLSASYKVIGSSKEPAVVYSAIINNPIVLFCSILGLFFLLKIKKNITLPTNWLQKLLSLFFAYCTWRVTIYNSGYRSINAIITNHPLGVLFSLLTIGSYFILFEYGQGVMTYLYSKKIECDLSKYKKTNKIIAYYAKRPFLITFLLIFSVWLLVAISSFPGIFMGDTLDQVEQFFGYKTRTAAHPVMSTLFIGGFVKLGSLLGSANLGVFIYTVVQLLILSLLIAYAVKIIHGVTNKSGALLIVTLLIGLLPSINGVVILATKDIVFSGFFVVYLTTGALYLLRENYFFEKKLWIMFTISIIFMMLFRYNSLHFIVLSLIVFLIAEIIGKKKILRKTSLILMTIGALLVGSGINKVLIASFSEKEQAPQWEAMLSLPFQHTARYVTYHEDDISKADKEIINQVLEYDKLKDAYNPVLSDPVKRKFRKDATPEERSAYFKVLSKQVTAHPLLALETLTSMHGSLFNVNQSVNWYYGNTVVHEGYKKGMMKRYEKLELSDVNAFSVLNDVRFFFYFLWDRLPIFSQLNNYGFQIYLFLSMFVLSLRRKRYDLAGIFIPLGAFVGTLIAGPITQGYLRFELPIMLFTPLAIVLFFSFNVKKEDSVSDKLI